MMMCKRKPRGKGFVNDLINKLPIELHIPGYQYCGPGTKLKERLARGDMGINPLDAACKEHDIAYSRNRENLGARHAADKILEEKARNRVLAKDATFGEKAAAWGVQNTMKIKRKLGMGTKKNSRIKNKTGCGKPRGKKKGRGHKKKIHWRQIVEAAKSSMSPGANAVKSALKGAQEAVKLLGGRKRIQTMPRILPVPSKIGGLLPAFLIPLFAGLSATGALAGGAAGIAKAVNDSKAAQQALDESKRHNRTMESIALGKGLYLKPYKKGLGLHLRPKNG